MATPTIQRTPSRLRLRGRPLLAAGAALLALEASLAAVGLTWPALSILALALGPGLALLPLLPARVLDSPAASLAAVPALGIAATSSALTSVAAVGVELGPVSVRLTLAALVAVGLALPRSEPALRFGRVELFACPGAALALGAALIIQQRVIGDVPVPGNDWAKYVLYGAEIERQGSLLIDNPFWMLGVPFREDPGAPSLYGAFLLMTAHPPAALQQGIGLFALAQVLSLFALGRALWGPLAGVVAAALWATLPINYTLLGWHGVANAVALVLLPIALLYLAVLVWDGLRARDAAGFALVFVGLAAAHRLSLGVGLAAGALTLGLALVALPERMRLARSLALTAVFLVLLGSGVAYDLITRARTFGGTQEAEAYAATKIDLELLIRDLTVPFVAATLAALVAVLVLRADRRPLIPVISLLAAVTALAVSWIVDFPLYYTRMAYYLPLAMVPLIAAATAALPRPAVGGAVALMLVVVAGTSAWSEAGDVRRFYQFADAGSIRGLGHLRAALGPGEVVVTDRCWSFLSTWLLRTPTLPALDPTDIQPKAELPFARAAQAVLDDTPRGRAIVRRRGIRFALVDPTCVDAEGRRRRPPPAGRPLFVSRRLVVVRIAGAR
jgi:hypothetical protein